MCVICGCANCNAQVVETVGGPGQVVGQFQQEYVLTGAKWGEDALGTSGGEITWSANLAGLVFNTTRFPNLKLTDFEEALQDAFNAWETVAQVTFREAEQGEDADVNIAMTLQDIGGFDFGTPFGTVGVASWFFNAGPVNNGVSLIQSGSIFFDAAESWVPFGDFANTVSFLSVATHEIGHILGLGHYDGSPQVMNSFATTDFLQPGDIAGIQEIYGARQIGSQASEFSDLGTGTTGATFNALGGDDVVMGTEGGDSISGGAGDDELFGRAGDDFLVDTSGANEISGGLDNDTIIGGRGVLRAEGDAGNDILIGGVGDDALQGGAGDDVLLGDPGGDFLFGNDILSAGVGADFLEGGGGADTFVFAPDQGTNVIASLDLDSGTPRAVGRDFDVGIDRVDLSAFNFMTFGDVLLSMSETQDGAEFNATGTRVVLSGVELEELTASDFIL
ncbi:MAG: matrixin family metalloprotease [Pseudomonadota bacterium]